MNQPMSSTKQVLCERHSTPNHPARRQLSTPPSEISMKCGIQHLWTNITPLFFIFSILALVQFLQPFENYSECWCSSNRGKTTERHYLLQLSIPRQLKALKTSNSPYLLKISRGFKKCGLKLSSTYQCL
jgi:hypothetical protein